MLTFNTQISQIYTDLTLKNLRKSAFSICVICVLAISACGQKTLSEQKLSETIADVYLTESILKQKQIPLQSPEAAAYYEQTLEKHNVTQEQYEKSILYYANKKPKELGVIFENARKRLELIVTGIEQDSIRSLYVEPKPAKTADTLAQ